MLEGIEFTRELVVTALALVFFGLLLLWAASKEEMEKEETRKGWHRCPECGKKSIPALFFGAKCRDCGHVLKRKKDDTVAL